MDSGFDTILEHPREKANIFSKLFFGWMLPLCRKGAKQKLDVIDIYKTLKSDKSDILTDRLEQQWELEVARAKAKNETPSLLRALLKTFFWQYMIYGLYLFISFVVISSTQPIVLAYFISLFSHDDHSLEKKIISGALLIFESIVLVFFIQHNESGQSAIGMRIRVAVSSLIYRKMLKLNNRSLGQTAAGQVVNLLSNDVSRFDFIMTALHYLWLMPIQIGLVTYLIWELVGVSCLAGVLSMALLTLPVQAYLGKLTSIVRLKVAEKADARIKLMNEIISGILVIKMYAWEKSFENVIQILRKNEVKFLKYASYLRAVYMSSMVYIERTTLFLTIVCYILLGNAITSEQVFAMARFFNLLQLAMAIYFPLTVTLGAETLVSVRRLQNFLTMEEKPLSVIKNSNDGKISLDNVTASWVNNNDTLKNLKLEIPQGCLCAIIGSVGAGKSSILQLLLGEIAISTGSITIGGNISYASQEAWLFSASIRKNILFGLEYDRKRYKEVVKVCALEKDFEMFQFGDKTIVGERGASLSGGQRARVNLARAIYREADIYLLDDPLSAVDTHVGRQLFDDCIRKHLRNKTRVLVTHQLQYLQNADWIVVMNEGRIEAQGTFEEISSKNLDFSKLLADGNEAHDKEELTSNQNPQRKISLRRTSSVRSKTSVKSDISQVDQEREQEVLGNSGSTPLKDYIKASGNNCLIFSLCLILILSQLSCSSTDYWVSYWTQQEEIRNTESYKTHDTELAFKLIPIYRFIPISNESSASNLTKYQYDLTESIVIDGEPYNLIRTNIAIYIYTVLILATITFTMMRAFVFFTMAMKSSKNLHNQMFHSLLKAPMFFFNNNPGGRVLNRFSKDIGAVDELLPRVMMDALQILLVMVGILVMVVVANYYMIIPIFILGVLFLKIRTWYVATAKDIKHIEGITKSPVFSQLQSSLNGITTIRSAKAEEILKQQFDHHQDVHTSAWFLTISCRVCFGLWLDLICVIFITIIVISFIILDYYSNVNGSLVGLALSQALILTGMLQYGIRQTAEVVNQLTSVERVMQYTKLDNEEKNASTERFFKENWPESGCIVFRNLSLRYSEEDDLVLKSLNITIPSGTKVGIVGRTGAGKSSIISALFRLAPTEGEIFIDGIETKTIPLQKLRRKISIIPQEPVLFSASLRYNLDPFNEFDDESIWNAIQEVELKEAISSLDFMVSEGGSNFSLGQRQLLCLARAILRNNRILILDEATASVDPKTDALIQTTIRRKFKKCTVLTIAHRLNTIMDSDKVLVMNAGEAVEYDHPHILLTNTEGYFYKLVLETGPTMTEQLKRISQQFYLLSIKED